MLKGTLLVIAGALFFLAFRIIPNYMGDSAPSMIMQFLASLGGVVSASYAGKKLG